MSKVTVLLVGHKGSGKTTVFNTIKSFRPEATEVQFAGKLKEVCARAFHLPLEFFEDQDLKEKVFESGPKEMKYAQLNEIYTLFGVPTVSISQNVIEQHYGRVFRTPRQIAQYVGTEVLRSVKDTIHSDLALTKASELDFSVITDCRFPNEFQSTVETFHGSGRKVLTVAIHRMTAEEIASQDPHPSEAYVQKIQQSCEYHLSNNGTFEDLQQQIKGLLSCTGNL